MITAGLLGLVNQSLTRALAGPRSACAVGDSPDGPVAAAPDGPVAAAPDGPVAAAGVVGAVAVAATTPSRR